MGERQIHIPQGNSFVKKTSRGSLADLSYDGVKRHDAKSN